MLLNTTSAGIPSHHTPIRFGMYDLPRHEGTPLSMKGDAHAAPQQAVAGPPGSPVRPSTAQSTIRAVPPSPPLSINDALRLDLAENPARPCSDISPDSPRVRSEDGQGEEQHGESFATEHVGNVEDECRYTGTSVSSQGTVVRHRGAESKRSAPAEIRSRSHSPRKQPFRSLPKLPRQTPGAQDQHVAATMEHNRADDDNIDEEDDSYERNGPETPTPMSREQRIQAYTPLSVPPPLFSTNCEQSQREGNSVRKAASVKGQPAHTLHHKHALPQPSPSERNFKPHLRDMVSAARSRGHLPPAIEEQTRARVKTSPAQRSTRYASSSARSNVSGATVDSKRSVFSTPGRDEMERKKALVEDDEGPFAGARTVQDLNARRRQISGMTGDDEEGGWRGSRKRRQGCGMGERCCVM